MTALLTLAWLLFTTGALASWTFVGLYLVDVKPWRRRPGEDVRARLMRRDILAWSSAVALLYLSSVGALITLHAHPSTDAGRLAGSAVVAGLVVHRLVTYIRIQRRSA